MKTPTFLKSTALVLALVGTMTCCANQSKETAETEATTAETEATTDKFESPDWQLYNLRGKVKSCTQSKVMAELVGTDQLKAIDEEPIVQKMAFDESGLLLSNNYYKRSAKSSKATEYGSNPNDPEVVVKVKRNGKGYITGFEGKHKKFGEDYYDGNFRIENSFDDRGNLTTSAFIGGEWSETTNYKYDPQDVYAEIEYETGDYGENTKETATVKVIETDAHGNWTKAYLFCKTILETESLESDEKVISKGDDTYYILTRKITYWE